MTKHHGYRTKTRRIFRKKVRDRGLPGLTRFMVEYEVGYKVDIIADPSYQKRGFPHKRFHGKTGIITSIRGRCYEINVKDQNKMKIVFIGKEHLRLNRSDQMLREAAASQ
jgi:large subunit ribosomal protein L21e